MTAPERPVVGVGAVLFDDDLQSVVVVRRGHEPMKGDWSLPGGRVETGETLEAALAREVLEETGISVTVGPVVEVLDRIHRSADGRVEFHFVIVDYLCSRIAPDEPCPGSDADDARWVKLTDLADYRLTEKALSVIEKARAIAATQNTPARPSAR